MVFQVIRSSLPSRRGARDHVACVFLFCHPKFREGRAVFVFTSAIVFLLLFSGCAIGPHDVRPAIETPPSYRGQLSPALRASLADLPWWDVYQDETLKGLIETALTNNFDLRVAIRRMEQARAIASQSRAQLMPTLGYQYETSRGRAMTLTGIDTVDSSSAVLSASWEIDLWGQLRQLHGSDRARYLASEENRRAVTMKLVGDVAQAYFELLELDLEMDIARQTTNSFGESLRIFQARFAGGVVSELETSRAEAALANVASYLPELERQIVLKENQINLLLGCNPGPVSRSSTLLQQTMLPEVPTGLPSSLLERRPDVRGAEEGMRSANALVGASRAGFFPTLKLTAVDGKMSEELNAFGSDSERTWSVGGVLTGPIFEGGRLVAQYEGAKAAWEEAKAIYEQAVVNAFQDVSAALISREKLESVRVQQQRAVDALTKAVRVSTERYIAGKADYFEVLEAQQQLFPAQNLLAKTQLNQLLAIVSLYKALGGGWDVSAADKK
jgi:outer membrane protein, multidrug efflux system